MRSISIAKGKGSRVWDSNGKEYLDFVAGFGVAIIGHNNSFVNSAIQSQMSRISANPQIFHNDAREALIKKMLEVLPKENSRMFFGNSGAESVECALKIARKFTGRKKFISMKRGFHGRTLGALSATWKPAYRQSFEPLLEGFEFAEFNSLESVEKLADSETAGIIIEPVQGEGGIFKASIEFMKGLRELCDSKGIALIFDEVQTGFGRTGKFFALGHYGIVPDIICTNKGMGNGFPVGATAARPEIFEALGKSEHQSTMGGNPLASAAAGATIEFILKNSLCGNAERIGNRIKERLSQARLEGVREVRAAGMMIGIELRAEAMPKIAQAMEKGLLVYNSGINVIRMLPPITTTAEEADRACEILEAVL